MRLRLSPSLIFTLTVDNDSVAEDALATYCPNNTVHPMQGSKIQAVLHDFSTLPDRLKNAIFEFDMLSSHMDELEGQVSGLQRHALDAYQQGELEALESSVTASQLVDVIATHEVHDSLAAFMRCLHHSIGRQTRQSPIVTTRWGLELRLPDQYGSVGRMRELSHIKLDFVVGPFRHVTDIQCSEMRRSRLHYWPQRYAVLPPNTIETFAASVQETLPIAAKFPLREHLPELEILTRPEKLSVSLKEHLRDVDLHAKQCSDERGHAESKPKIRAIMAENLIFKLRTHYALRLANWTMLLMTTPWFGSLCSCFLQSLTDQKGEVLLLLWLEAGAHIERHDCHTSVISNGHLFRLGVILCELAIAKPLVAVSPPSLLRFPDNSFLDKEDVLYLVTRMTDPVYASVVRYCFEADAKLTARRSKSLRAQDLSILHQRIIQP